MFARYIRHPGTGNFLWLAGDKVLRMLVGILVVSWVARHLGIEQFGLFTYVSVWVAIVVGTATLGMDALILRDIIRRPTEASELLGTAMMFRAMASAVGGTLVILLVMILRCDDHRAALYVALLGIGALFQGLESGELWFQARLQMRRLVLPRLALFMILSAAKLLMVLSGAGVTVFVAVSALEMAVGGILTWLLVRWSGDGVGRLRVDMQMGLTLLRECYPLALSGLVVVLYIRITGLLVAGLLDDTALGIYSAATRITEASYFLPGVLASSTLPWLLRQRAVGVEAYRAARLHFFRVNAIIGFALVLPLAFGGKWLVNMLYGDSYSAAGPVLQVHAITILFAFLGVARGQHFLNERQTGWALRFSIWGLLLNVMLCIVTIPVFGLMGAAWGAVLAYALSSVGTSFIFKATRHIGVEQITALFSPWLLFKRRVTDY